MTSAPSTKRRGADKGQVTSTEPPAKPQNLTQLDPNKIIVSPQRLRVLDMSAAEAIARSFELVGQLQPIRVSIDAQGIYHLDVGLHRLHAAKSLGWQVDTIVTAIENHSAHQRRLSEIFENIIRPDLRALERAVMLAELKALHEGMHPDARNGGDRRSADARAKRDQNEIFSFSSVAAERTGLSARAIEISVAIARNLSANIKARLTGTWLANHQAGLSLLAQQDAALQTAILDLLFAPVETRQAETVAEALALAQGKALLRPADIHWQALTNKMARASREQRLALFKMYEDEIVAFVKSKGLV
jgi:ParB family chromosome partitioning protein